MRKSFLYLPCIIFLALVPASVTAESQNLDFYEKDSAASVFEGQGPDVYTPPRDMPSSDDGEPSQPMVKERRDNSDSEWGMRENDNDSEATIEEEDNEEGD